MSFQTTFCFERDEYPGKMRTSKVLPISKKIKKMICLINYCQSYRIINNYQYVFRTKTSTGHALASTTHYITSNLDNGYFIMGIILDLR